VKAIEAAQPLGTSFLPDPQQVEMFRQKDGSLSPGAIHVVRGRGRPPGARNRRSKKVADLYVQRYGDPLDAIGQLANTPLRQLIEVLMEADGSAAREARLLEGVEEALAHIKALSNRNWTGDINTSRELATDLADAIDRLALAAERISGKPGKLALDALALQMQAHVKALEYVHGKQPIAIDIRNRADVVVVAPELLKEYDIDPQELAAQIAEHGLDALDASTMRLIEHVEDGEFTEAPDAQEGDQ
jgi:hypothetical protein